MTDDPQTEPAPADPPSEPTTSDATDPAPAEPDQAGGSEAARYRRQLRAAEKERDGLATQLDAMRRAEVRRLATTGDGPTLHAATDVFGDAFDLADLLDDAGAVDPGKVRAAIEHHTDGRHHLRADIRTPKPDPSQGSGRGTATAPTTGEGWATALRGR